MIFVQVFLNLLTFKLQLFKINCYVKLLQIYVVARVHKVNIVLVNNVQISKSDFAIEKIFNYVQKLKRQNLGGISLLFFLLIFLLIFVSLEQGLVFLEDTFLLKLLLELRGLLRIVRL